MFFPNLNSDTSFGTRIPMELFVYTRVNVWTAINLRSELITNPADRVEMANYIELTQRGQIYDIPSQNYMVSRTVLCKHICVNISCDLDGVLSPHR